MNALKATLAKAQRRYQEWRKKRDERNKRIEKDRRRRKALRKKRRELIRHRRDVQKRYEKIGPDSDGEYADKLKGELVKTNHQVHALHEKLEDLGAKIDRAKPKLQLAAATARWYVQIRIPAIRKKIEKAQHEAGTVNGWNPQGSSLVTFDGKQTAEWIAYRLYVARAAGISFYQTSGFRTPEYSRYLCQQICGQDSCAGLCAGVTSNHTQHVYPGGATDDTNAVTLRAFWRNAASRIPGVVLINNLPYDVVHSSASGR